MHCSTVCRFSGKRPTLSTILCRSRASRSNFKIHCMSVLSHCRERIPQQLSTQPEDGSATTIYPVSQGASLDSIPGGVVAAWARVNSFKAKSGEFLAVPGPSGDLACVILGLGEAKPAEAVWAYAALPGKLPAGTYKLSPPTGHSDAALLGWILGCYKFTRYKTGKLDPKGSKDSVPPEGQDVGGAAAPPLGGDAKPVLLVPQGSNVSLVMAMAEAIYWARDLINTPAEDCGPQHMKAEAEALVQAHAGAQLQVVEGDELLQANWPAVHTVGRAAARAPVVLDINWQPSGIDSSNLPVVALVGKGVCFDTGGLDIKTAAGMRLMKKDMGGAALVLALAHVIMSAQLPVKLRVLVPAVENAISGNAYRPGDVLQTRAGITVENGNTDAEGRLILCDAIWEAANGGENPPDVLIDAATLTGAARVALGAELPAVFSNNDEVWQQLEAAAKSECDPLWRLPLWAGYRKMLDSKVADIGSTGDPGTAGSITAALFLQEFAKAAPAWLHIDTAGWVSGGSTGPGRPEGGEALGIRALWTFLNDRYNTKNLNNPSASQ